MYTKLPSLPRICYCVSNPTCCSEYWDKISLFFFVLNWQLLFNIFGAQTYCLYKLLWLCIAYWMGCVDWIIKVVHFLYWRMFPLAFFSKNYVVLHTWCSWFLQLKGTMWRFLYKLSHDAIHALPFAGSLLLFLAFVYQQDCGGALWVYTRCKQNRDPLFMIVV